MILRHDYCVCAFVVATAILDRLPHHRHVITLSGDSYRLRTKRNYGNDSKLTINRGSKLDVVRGSVLDVA
jgi:IstB-like ATP binding protein